MAVAVDIEPVSAPVLALITSPENLKLNIYNDLSLFGGGVFTVRSGGF